MAARGSSWPSWPVELAERVAAQPDDPGRARELESTVRRLAAGARPFDDLALEVAGRLNQPRAASVRDLSRATGLSEHQIHFMWLDDRGIGCPSCSAFVDQIGHLAHLMPGTPRLRLSPVRRWPRSTFDESVAPIEYNYRTRAELEQAGFLPHLLGLRGVSVRNVTPGAG